MIFKSGFPKDDKLKVITFKYLLSLLITLVILSSSEVRKGTSKESELNSLVAGFDSEALDCKNLV